MPFEELASPPRFAGLLLGSSRGRRSAGTGEGVTRDGDEVAGGMLLFGTGTKRPLDEGKLLEDGT